MDLTELIDQFLGERNQLGLMSIARVSSYRNELVGTTRPFDRIGFVRFLKDLGITRPSAAEFNTTISGVIGSTLLNTTESFIQAGR